MENFADHAHDFDPDDFLANLYRDLSSEACNNMRHKLQSYHEAFQALPFSLKILEFGCGPVIQHAISAAAHASEVVFSDISESNREAVKKWLQKDPTSFNWSPHFDHVVQIFEGKGEKEAREREETLRHVVKAVVYCNVLEDTTLEEGFEGPYDVIIESGCLAAACTSTESFKEAVLRLNRLLKPGGRMLMWGPENDMKKGRIGYIVGGKKFNCLCYDRNFLCETFKETGFKMEYIKFYDPDSVYVSDGRYFANVIKN